MAAYLSPTRSRYSRPVSGWIAPALSREAPVNRRSQNMNRFLAALSVGSLLSLLAPVSNAGQQQAPTNMATTHASPSQLTYKIIDAPKHTYCYDVFADGRLMIHQTSVPALPNNEGFKTKEDATKVALLVIDKIRKGEMPPTISIDEMKKLNVIK